jgi:hypothetical protein
VFLRTFLLLFILVLSEVPLPSDISASLFTCFVRSSSAFGHFCLFFHWFCPKFLCLRTFLLPFSLVLSEVPLPSDISASFFTGFVRSSSAFGHCCLFSHLFCPNNAFPRSFPTKNPKTKLPLFEPPLNNPTRQKRRGPPTSSFPYKPLY